MKLFVALAFLAIGATALPQSKVQDPYKWRKADPLFEHQLKTRNLFANPINTVFNTHSGRQAATSGIRKAGKIVPSERIINGAEATDGQFPWVVYVRCTNPGWACTGSLISENWVLSAAHCIIDCTSWDIQAGSKSMNRPDDNRVTISTTEGTYNPGFNFFNLHDDIGVIYLPEAAPLNDFITLSNLPGASDLDNQFEDDLMTLSGWGITCDSCGQPDVMNFLANVPIMPNPQCEQLFSNVNEGMICIDTDAGDGGVCSGDSGGPLNRQLGGNEFMQVGVASFVSGAGCEAARYPHVYARVTTYMEWISDNTGIPIGA